MTSVPRQLRAEGLFQIGSASGAPQLANVILVHGLGGHYRQTWHPNGSADDDNFWPRWLADDLPEVGVWAYAFEAFGSSWLGGSMSIYDQASALLESVELRFLDDLPMIFIGHSLGGLIVKDALRTAHSFGRATIISTNGVAYIATPHVGSRLATVLYSLLRGGVVTASPHSLQTLLARIAGKLLNMLARLTVSIDELQSQSSYLRSVDDWYRQQAPRLQIATVAFIETRPLRGVMVVGEADANPNMSAVLATPIAADHLEIARPHSRETLIYQSISQFVRSQASRAKGILGFQYIAPRYRHLATRIVAEQLAQAAAAGLNNDVRDLELFLADLRAGHS